MSLWVCAAVEYAVVLSLFFRTGDFETFMWECPAFPCMDYTHKSRLLDSGLQLTRLNEVPEARERQRFFAPEWDFIL